MSAQKNTKATTAIKSASKTPKTRATQTSSETPRAKSSASSPKACVIVVTYNRKTALKKCLKTLLKEADSCKADVILIDNASTDGTKDYIKSLLPRLTYINTGENLGGAGGFSYGVNVAVQKSYDYAWLMDDDVSVTPGSLKSLLVSAEKLSGNFSFLSSLVRWTDGSLCVMNKQRMLNPAHADKDGFLTDAAANQITGLAKISTSSFVGFFVNLKHAKTVGLPIKDFFIYGDDLEYSARLLRAAPAYLDFSSLLVHEMGSNLATNIIYCPADRIPRQFYDFRNRGYIYRHYPGTGSKLGYILRCPYLCLKILIKSPNKKFRRISATIRGTFSGLFFNPKIEMPHD